MLRLAKSDEIEKLTRMSKAAFDSDVDYGGNGGGPTGYDSIARHIEWYKEGILYSFEADGDIVGGAVLKQDMNRLHIYRIFIEPKYFHKGYGIKLMDSIEKVFAEVNEFTLDTPAWNTRTNLFYKKCGYVETGREQTPEFELVLFKKAR